MVTDRVKLLLKSNNNSCMGFRLAYLYLTLEHSKGQDQGHAQFDNKYLGNSDRYETIITVDIKYRVMSIKFRL